MKRPRPQELLDFSNRVVVVTGAGRGIGAGVARRFAAAGASVLVHFRHSEPEAQEIVAAIEASGGRAFAVSADVTGSSGVARLVQRCAGELGPPDVWVNNAGSYPRHDLLEMSEAEWDEVVDANLKSVQLGTQAAAKAMIAADLPGAIVNIASIEATNPAPHHSHYVAAKAGVLMHTKAAALELGPRRIRVNAVSPGLIWREGLDDDWPAGVERYGKAAPLGRLGRVEDVADACLFLASPAASWVTGTELIVDGGVMCHQIY